MHLFDIVILLVFSITIFLGLTKGFVQSLLSFVRLGVACGITFFYHVPFKKMLISMTSIEDVITKYVSSRITVLGGVASENTVNMVDLEIMKVLPLPTFLREELTTQLTASLDGKVSEYGGSVVAGLSDIVLTFFAIVLLFIVITLILVALSGLVNSLTNLPIIKTFNKLGGAIMGTINGYAISSVILLFVMALNTMFTISFIQDALINSVLIKMLMEYNVFVIFKMIMALV